MGIPAINNWLSYSVRRMLLDRDLAKVRDKIRGRVLEIGCGKRPRRGRFAVPLGNTESWVYYDINASCSPDICGDIQSLSLKDNNFDTILCLEMLEYVEKPMQSLLELSRVLKKDGCLILSIPFMCRFDTEHDFWRISDHGLKLLLKNAGLTLQVILKQGGPFSVMAGIIKLLVHSLTCYRMKLIIAAFIYAPVTLLIKIDNCLSRFVPGSGTLSTGYLTVAGKSGGAR